MSRQIVTLQVTAEGADPFIILFSYDNECVEVAEILGYHSALEEQQWVRISSFSVQVAGEHPCKYRGAVQSIEDYLKNRFKDDDPDDLMDVQLSAFNRKAETWNRTRLKALPSLVAAYFKEAM